MEGGGDKGWIWGEKGRVGDKESGKMEGGVIWERGGYGSGGDGGWEESWHSPTPPVSEGLGLAAAVSSSETPTLIGWLFLPSQFLLGFGEHVLFLL